MRYDVAVVGAGPSGAWTAALLARRGARVALLDPSHPREKPCGGGITARALALVADAFPPASLRSVPVRAARFIGAGTDADALIPLHTNAGTMVVASRTEFDALLYTAAGKAGAECVGTRVTTLEPHGSGFRLGLASGGLLEAHVVVGADGANSLVRRRAAAPFRRDQLSIATGYFARGVTSDEIVIQMMTDPPGYIWSFPRPDHLAIGICAQADAGVQVGTLRARVHEWIQNTRIAAGAHLEAYSWPIPSLAAGDFATVAVSGPGWMTVGDAAGLVDPITREGIFFALQSAVFAADALTSDDANPSRIFADRVRDEIGTELARAARYKAGFFRPQFSHLMLDALRSSARVRGVMADLVAGTQSYGDLAWRLARTCEARLAWRFLSGVLGRPS